MKRKHKDQNGQSYEILEVVEGDPSQQHYQYLNQLIQKEHRKHRARRVILIVGMILVALVIGFHLLFGIGVITYEETNREQNGYILYLKHYKGLQEGDQLVLCYSGVSGVSEDDRIIIQNYKAGENLPADYETIEGKVLFFIKR